MCRQIESPFFVDERRNPSNVLSRGPHSRAACVVFQLDPPAGATWVGGWDACVCVYVCVGRRGGDQAEVHT